MWTIKGGMKGEMKTLCVDTSQSKHYREQYILWWTEMGQTAQMDLKRGRTPLTLRHPFLLQNIGANAVENILSR